MGCYVLDLQDIDKTKIVVVGGKGANLGDLAEWVVICLFTAISEFSPFS